MRLRVSPWPSFLFLLTIATAQQQPPNGPKLADPGWHALVGADVVVRPGERLANATVVVRNGRIVELAAGGKPPDGARVWDCKGLVLYPGLIECCLPVDAPAPDAAAPATHWNPMVLPQRSALAGAGVGKDERAILRELGFAAAAITPTGGVFKGTAAVVLLDEPREGERAPVVRERAYELVSFQTKPDGYPDSGMGAIALLRQTLFDADWYERCFATCKAQPTLQPPPVNAALAALVADRALPLGFDVDDELEVLRAAKVATETNRSAFVLGSGMEFRRLQAVAKTGLPLVVPLQFPKAPEVTTIAKAEKVSLRQLLSWEQAPTNSKRLLDAGVRLAWTTLRMQDKKEFRARVREAMACGLTADQALAALTTVPAELLGVSEVLGTLQPGKIANLVVVAGELFDSKSEIRQVWVGGRPLPVLPKPDAGLDGKWNAALQLGAGLQGVLTIDAAKVTLQLGDQHKDGSKVAREPQRVDFCLPGELLGSDGTATLHASLFGEQLLGDGRIADGSMFRWSATRAGPVVASTKDEKVKPPPALIPLPLPLGNFGLLQPPAARDVAIIGATLWTGDERGILERGALLVHDGKIAFAGPAENLPELPAGAAVIEATGKHVTPGIMDCHSHTGISRGVNEAGKATSAEVRIQDVVNPDDVGWYRELAGGVTAVNQLHGSANAIGGQSWTVKLRWGCVHPDDMTFAGAPAGIKFALGENPRRANGDGSNTRYPNTRMGVEALIRDRLLAAAEYRRVLQEYEAMPARYRASVLPPRRDLELEAIAEILAGTRRIHCHSYRQDEIFMLCGLAREFGCRIGTFQHVLEGYKVAEAIRQNAIGASSFSDWWAYKLEVQDAIPENGAIMREAGVIVTFNSDSNELARRLNTEAGKAVKYGGVPPAEALKFVTLNTAIQLGVADRVGSLQQGKDADFAIWSGDPLAYTSRCEQTWVDGRPMFTLEQDQQLRAQMQTERARLLQKALAEREEGGGKDQQDKPDKPGLDAYWRAEDLRQNYCCGDAEGGGR